MLNDSDWLLKLWQKTDCFLLVFRLRGGSVLKQAAEWDDAAGTPCTRLNWNIWISLSIYLAANHFKWSENTSWSQVSVWREASFSNRSTDVELPHESLCFYCIGQVSVTWDSASIPNSDCSHQISSDGHSQIHFQLLRRGLLRMLLSAYR